MKETEKEKLEKVALTSSGAVVGGAGGATVGVIELAATQGTVTELSASAVIGLGAVAGALACFFGYKAYQYLKKPKE
jgi:outer membrane lipoprotein SlyB